MRPITLRVMAVMAALLVTFCRAGDDRLLDPGSAGEESPGKRVRVCYFGCLPLYWQHRWKWLGARKK